MLPFDDPPSFLDDPPSFLDDWALRSCEVDFPIEKDVPWFCEAICARAEEEVRPVEVRTLGRERE